MKKQSRLQEIADDYKRAVEALQNAREIVGKRLGGRAGITISMKRIALTDERDLYCVLDDLLKQVTENKP